jgi:hypothetical protein
VSVQRDASDTSITTYLRPSERLEALITVQGMITCQLLEVGAKYSTHPTFCLTFCHLALLLRW